MAQIKLNTFTSYQQTEQEQLAATHLTTEQKQFIQTQIALVAEERLALTPDPSNYTAFIQQEAHLKGQIDAYKYLLDCAVMSEQQLLEAAQQSQ